MKEGGATNTEQTGPVGHRLPDHPLRREPGLAERRREPPARGEFLVHQLEGDHPQGEALPVHLIHYQMQDGPLLDGPHLLLGEPHPVSEDHHLQDGLPPLLVDEYSQAAVGG